MVTFATNLVASPISASRPTTQATQPTPNGADTDADVAAPAPRTENIEVRATHLGYGHQLETLRIIADRLAQPEGEWTPYAGVADRADAADSAAPDGTAHGRAG